MQRVKIEWDLSDSQGNVDISELDLPTEVEVPDSIDYHECADWLSDEYGWCVKSLTLIKD